MWLFLEESILSGGARLERASRKIKGNAAFSLSVLGHRCSEMQQSLDGWNESMSADYGL
jgi:hypothetical protein